MRCQMPPLDLALPVDPATTAGRVRYAEAMGAWVLRVSLLEVSPEIWRRVAVPADIPLGELHLVLNAAMGWEDYHLHCFEVGEVVYGVPDPDPDGFEGSGEVDEAGHLLSDIAQVGARLVYVYDFGDGWHHRVEVEREAPDGEFPELPICLEGAGHCPPEDCGGVGGFEVFCAAMADPSHEEHPAYWEWYGRPFDPSVFDLAQTNRTLRLSLREEQECWHEEHWPEPLKHLAELDGEQPAPIALEDRIVGLGGDAVPCLLDLVHQNAPSADLAVGMLVAIGCPTALEAVREELRLFLVEEITFGDACAAVAALGPGLVEPLLADLEEAGSQESDHRDALLTVLVHIGLHDDQILRQLKVDTERDAALGAFVLAGYGDRRALPFLSSMLDDRQFAPGEDDRPPGEDISELAAAIEDLGGRLTAAQEEKLAAVLDYREAARRQADAQTPFRRPGRNDPCWCSSGRKYKLCHLRSDEAETGRPGL